MPTNLVYEDVEGPLGEGEMVDVTEDVLRMLERDNGMSILQIPMCHRSLKAVQF